MVYMGSKNRIAKELIPIITKYLTEDRWYVEPFCGGCNMIDKVNHQKRIANDYNKYLVALFIALQQGVELPSEISKDEYYKVKDNKDDYPDWYVGFVGFVCSYRGKFFNGWIDKEVVQKNGKIRNRFVEQRSNLDAQRNNIKNITYSQGTYSRIKIPALSIIYCDPPYQDTTSYKNAEGFDHDSFWQWCRDMTHKGCDVLISEYQAPSDFVCVWSKGINMNLSGGKGKTAVEKLFVHESIAHKYKQEVQINLF